MEYITYDSREYRSYCSSVQKRVRSEENADNTRPECTNDNSCLTREEFKRTWEEWNKAGSRNYPENIFYEAYLKSCGKGIYEENDINVILDGIIPYFKITQDQNAFRSLCFIILQSADEEVSVVINELMKEEADNSSEQSTTVQIPAYVNDVIEEESQHQDCQDDVKKKVMEILQTVSEGRISENGNYPPLSREDLIQATRKCSKGISSKERYIAHALYVIYSSISENAINQVLADLKKAYNVKEELSVREMKKLAFKRGNITRYLMPCIECPRCKKWTLTTKVFCPYCTAEDLDQNEMKKCQLVECNCKSCKACKLSYTSEDKSIECRHISRKKRGKCYYVLSPEFVIVEFFRSRLMLEMFCLEEDELVEEIEKARILQYHSPLFSENSLKVYRELHLDKAAEALEQYLAFNDDDDSVSLIESLFPEVMNDGMDCEEQEGSGVTRGVQERRKEDVKNMKGKIIDALKKIRELNMKDFSSNDWKRLQELGLPLSKFNSSSCIYANQLCYQVLTAPEKVPPIVFHSLREFIKRIVEEKLEEAIKPEYKKAKERIIEEKKKKKTSKEMREKGKKSRKTRRNEDEGDYHGTLGNVQVGTRKSERLLARVNYEENGTDPIEESTVDGIQTTFNHLRDELVDSMADICVEERVEGESEEEEEEEEEERGESMEEVEEVEDENSHMEEEEEEEEEEANRSHMEEEDVQHNSTKEQRPSEFVDVDTDIKKKHLRRNRDMAKGIQEDGDNKDFLNGVDTFKRLFFSLSCSGDGVQVFNESRGTSTSVWPLTIFFNNLPQRRVQEKLDSVFCFIVPSNEGYKGEYVNKGSIEFGYSHPTAFEERKMGESVDGFYTKDNRSDVGSVNPADSTFRQITALFLQQLKEFGEKGLCLRVGNTLFGIQYALINFKADLPAHYLFLDSSGRQNSTRPCTKCKVVHRSCDPILCKKLEGAVQSAHNHIGSFKTMDSAMVCLPPDDPLRLLVVMMWLRDNINMEGVLKETVENRVVMEVKELFNSDENTIKNVVKETMEEVMLELKKLKGVVSLFPKKMVISRQAEQDYYPEYSHKEEYHPYNNPATVGVVNIKENTFLEPEDAISVDIMHKIHADAKRFLLFIFSKYGWKEVSVDDILKYYGDDKKKILSIRNKELQLGVELNGVSIGDYNFYRVDEAVKERMRTAFKNMTELPTSFAWVTNLVENGELLSMLKAEWKLVFCFSILPGLAFCCLDDPKIWGCVNYFIVLSELYNHDGSFKRAKELQTLLLIVMTHIENHFYPSFSTIYSHKSIHLFRCFRANGTLKSNDTFGGEQSYNGLRNQATGGPNQVMTMMNRTTDQEQALIVAVDYNIDEDDMVVSVTWVRYQRNENDPVDWNDAFDRAVINLVADRQRLNKDLVPHLTFTDLEFCGGVENYYEESSDHCLKPTGLCANNGNWNTPNDVVKSFIKNHNMKKMQQSSMEIWSTFSDLGMVYYSLGKRANELSIDDFRSNHGFAVMRSICGRSHLLCVYKYISFTRNGKRYMQALVYEIPTHSVSQLTNSSYCCLVDVHSLKELNPSFTLVSIHRLHIGDLWITPLGDDLAYCGVLSVCIRQWKVFRKIYTQSQPKE